MRIRKFRKEIVFILDLITIIFTNFILFYLLPEENSYGLNFFTKLLPYLLLFLYCWSAAQYFFMTYDSLWRYAHNKEYLMMLMGGSSGFILFLVLEFLIFDQRVPFLFLIATTSLSYLGMIMMRMLYRVYRRYKRLNRKKYKKPSVPLAIIGAGDLGVRLLEELGSNQESIYQVKFFVDDSVEKIGKRIHNVKVKGPIDKLAQYLRESGVKVIVNTIPSLTTEKQSFILDVCSSLDCHVRILPDSLTLLKEEGQQLLGHLRDIKLEELLGREQIELNKEEIEEFLYNKVIMVTGGGGSIGAELCRQIANAAIKKLVIVDIYENNAYDIQQELLQLHKDKLEIKIEIASIRDREKMEVLMERHRPNVIFHAAAHKHVPLMEDCPDEAVLNNIFGTYNLVQAAHQYGADKFVLISTDKAVNPTNIMGASKRFCEMILQSMKDISETEFVAVRFGNVLGSNGSVIPLFQKQIEMGGPVTITDKRITRYFMTISEAVQLVLQAGAMANSSEIFVLDMGEPVKIIELAENLIRLNGRVPYTEIPIIETGLRPGEKLFEELLMNSKELIATSNHKIYIEHQYNISPKEIERDLEILSSALQTNSNAEIKKALKLVVPTYKDPEEVNKVAFSENNMMDQARIK